jgi:transposase
MEEYVGLDVSMKETCVCVVDSHDRVVAEGVVATCPDALARFVAKRAPGAVRIGLETGSLSGWLWRGLKGHGLPALVIDARHAHAGLKLQINKTDRKDAHGLARIMRTGWYREAEPRSPENTQTRHLLAVRSRLVAMRVDVDNQLRGLLKSEGRLVGKATGGRFAARIEELIADLPALQLAARPLLALRETLCKQVAGLDNVTRKAARRDPVVRRLMSTPGVGALTALAFRATVGDPHRFTSARAVGAWLGLTPRRYASGEIDRSGRISKCGDRMTRTLLYEAANVLLTRIARWSPLKAWAVRLAKRIGMKKARVALARKLAVVLLRIWTDGTNFRWSNKEAAMA